MTTSASPGGTAGRLPLPSEGRDVLLLSHELSYALRDAHDAETAIAKAIRVLHRFIPFGAAVIRLCDGNQESIFISSSQPLDIGVVGKLIDESAREQQARGAEHRECALGRVDVSSFDGLGETVEHTDFDGAMVQGLIKDEGVAGLVIIVGGRPFAANSQHLIDVFGESLAFGLRRIHALTKTLAAGIRSVAADLTEGLALVSDDLAVEPLNDYARHQLIAKFGRQAERHLPSDTWIADDILAAIRNNKRVERDSGDPGSDESVRAIVSPIGGRMALITFQGRSASWPLQERILQSEKMISLGQLVSGVAHELNNQLAAISGFSQLLLARDLDDEIRHQITTIFEEAERASDIIQNLLAFARQRTSEKTDVALNDLIRRVSELRAYDTRLAGIEITLELDEHLPTLRANPGEIQQLLFNIIVNAEQAIRSSEKGAGTITLQTGRGNDGVFISVSDTGTGMPPGLLTRIFDPFFTTKPVGEGTGLGLSICYSIVSDHGGTISARNLPGGGANFLIELPLGSPPQDTPLPYTSGEADEPAPRRSGRVLVVDDEPSIRTLIGGVLAMEGYDVELADSGETALGMLAEQQFDVLITDLKMRQMDGIELYHEVRRRNESLAGRTIFVTGDTVSELTRSSLKNTGRPYLEKPFRVEQIRAAVAEAMSVEHS